MVRCKLVLIDTANAESLLSFTQWVLDRMPLREPPLGISIRVGAVKQVPHDFERGSPRPAPTVLNMVGATFICLV